MKEAIVIIYLDYASSSPLLKEAWIAMLPFWQQQFGNPHSIHDIGQQSSDAINNARLQLALSIGSPSARSIIFTPGGTSANNLALFGTMRLYNKGDHFITTDFEHPSVLKVCQLLVEEGFCWTKLPVCREGIIDIEDVRKSLRPNTRLVSIMAANNEVGTVQPLEELSQLLKTRKIIFHTDAVQFFGKLPLDVKQLGVDLLSLSSHKTYGPKGIGALYVRPGLRLSPFIHGGGQERGLISGTLSTPLIIGLGAVASWIHKNVMFEMQRLHKLKEALWEGIYEIDGVVLNGHPTKTLPNILNVSFPTIEGQMLMLELNRQQIYISSSSACSLGKNKPSHVLLAMGRTQDEAYQSVRFSLGKDIDHKQIDIVIMKLKNIINNLRK